jgi:hypothetical protein
MRISTELGSRGTATYESYPAISVEEFIRRLGGHDPSFRPGS